MAISLGTTPIIEEVASQSDNMALNTNVETVVIEFDQRKYE